MGAVKIYSIQANSLWMVNRQDKGAFLDIKDAYLNESPFLKYMVKHGLSVQKDKSNSKGRSRDIVLLKFEYGVKVTEEYERKSAAEIRKVYYKNGVDITWNKYDKNTGQVVTSETVHYEMLMRSPGKAKKGECYFIKSDLLETARNYLTMELYDKMPEENAPLVEMSAYSTLNTATAMDYINIPLKNIFIIKDVEVETEVPAAIVRSEEVERIKKIIDFSAMEDVINEKGYTFYKNKQKKYPELELIKKSKKVLEECEINSDDYIYKDKKVLGKECRVIRSDKGKVMNVLWDGMGLIDESIFPADKEMNGFIYCRSHFFKSCLFRGNVVQFLKDYYKEDYDTATVTDMFGNKVKIKDIRAIITDKSIKWIKFAHLMGETEKDAYKYYKKVMKKHNEEFAIVKTAHASKWGDLQRSSYQINNSLPCTNKETLKKIAHTSVDYCNNLKTSHEKLMEHLGIIAQSYGAEKVWIELDKINSDFKNTQYFKSRKNTLISKFKNERLMLGKLLYTGDNLTACGNPLALLKNVVKKDGWKEENCFQVSKDYIECYTEKFSEGEILAGFRSPHNSPNNILSFRNVCPAELIKYFPNLGKNVIVVNGIGTDIQARANGQDYDTDAFFVTNQKEITELAQQSYKEYPTIINEIPPTTESKQTYNKDAESYANMDNSISSAQFAIGRSSNIAQLALSYYYDLKAREEGSEEELRDLEDMIDLVKEGVELQIEAMQDLIDKKNEALDKEKELYDYQKSIEEKSKRVKDIEKQLSSIQGDDSEENRKNIQELQNQLKEAKEDLSDAEYDKWLSDQSELMDSMLESYDETLNARFDDTDALINDLLNSTNENRDIINDTIQSSAENVGYTVTEGMKEVWSTESGLGAVVSNYANNFNEHATTVQKYLANIDAYFTSMKQKADEEAKKKQEQIANQNKPKPPASSGGNSKPPSNSNNGKGDGVARVGDAVTFSNGKYYYDSQGTAPAGSQLLGQTVYITRVNNKSWATKPYHIARDKAGKHPLGWVSLPQIKGYKDGTKNATKGLHLTDEEGLGSEVIVTKKGVLRQLDSGDTVFNESMVENLWDWGTINPNVLQKSMISTPVGKSTTDVKFNFGDVIVQDVQNPEQFAQKLVYVTKKYPKVQSAMQAVTVDQLNGGSKLGVNRIF